MQNPQRTGHECWKNNDLSQNSFSILKFKKTDDPVKGEANCNYVFTEEKYNFIMIL